MVLLTHRGPRDLDSVLSRPNSFPARRVKSDARRREFVVHRLRGSSNDGAAGFPRERRRMLLKTSQARAHLMCVANDSSTGRKGEIRALRLRQPPLPWMYVSVVLSLVVLFEVLPYLEELVRGIRAEGSRPNRGSN
jgi:hypothetical protein